MHQRYLRRICSDFVRASLALSLAGLGVIPGGCATPITDDVVERLSSEQMTRRVERDDTALIDAREPEAFATGHISGAINLRLAKIGPRAEGVPFGKRRPIVVYGANPGDASALAVSKRLIAAGYRNVFYYEGGYDAWVGARR